MDAAPLPADAADLADWLRLLLVPGVGRTTARQLLAAFGSPRDVVQADPAALREAVGSSLASAIGREPPEWARLVDATLQWRVAEADRHLLTLDHADYPRQLLESPDPPLLLLVQGDVKCLQLPAIAVVGSRRPTPQGRDHAQQFAQAFGEAGWVVTSGLAAGVDGAAHEGALASPGLTVAVVGTGPDRVYPPRHLSLARRVARRKSERRPALKRLSGSPQVGSSSIRGHGAAGRSRSHPRPFIASRSAGIRGEAAGTRSRSSGRPWATICRASTAAVSSSRQSASPGS